MKSNYLSNQTVVGFLIILVGILFLLDTLNIYNTSFIFRWAPSLLVVLGLWRLVASRFRSIIGPIIVISIGVFVQSILIGIDVGAFWPVVLIIIGLFILVGHNRLRIRRRQTDFDTVDGIGIFSGPHVSSNSISFKGGQITAIMGGIYLDLRNAVIDNTPAVVETTVLMGGAEIKVPENWIVQNDTLVLFGGTEDKRSNIPQLTAETPDLVITGLVLFGGLEIKD